MKSLGQQVRLFRELKGMGLNAYAQRLGVSAAYLSNLETGKTQTIKLDLLERLQDELLITTQTTSPTLIENDPLGIRVQRIHNMLADLSGCHPHVVDYFLSSLEEGIQLFLNRDKP